MKVKAIIIIILSAIFLLGAAKPKNLIKGKSFSTLYKRIKYKEKKEYKKRVKFVANFLRRTLKAVIPFNKEIKLVVMFTHPLAIVTKKYPWYQGRVLFAFRF